MFNLEDSSTYLWIRDQGVVIGKAEGIVVGLQESILNLGTARFGPPSESDAATLAGLTNPGALGDIVVYALKATGWSDLLTRGGSQTATEARRS